MLENQYALFRDLDRSCVAGSLSEADCREAVRLKRASIESPLFRDNPLVREVLAGGTTFVEVYDSFSRGLRGLRRLVPLPHNRAHNERLACLAQIVPNVRHFLRRSVFAADNPVTCFFYGLLAATAVSLIWAHSVHGDSEGPSGDDDGASPQLYLALAFGFAGFIVGSVSMLRYRTRDPKHIHAREAAGYMDVNYAFFRSGDDRAWADFIRAQGTACGVALARPDAD